MILELTLLGAGAGYWLRQKKHKRRCKHHPPHQRCQPYLAGLKKSVHTKQATQATQAKKCTLNTRRLLKEVYSTLQFTDKDQLLLDMTPALKQGMEKNRAASKKQLKLSVLSTGVALLAVFNPVFYPAGVAAVLYLSRENYKLIYRDIKRGHYLSFYLVSALANLGLMATGQLLLAALNGLVFGFLARMTNQLETVAQSRLMSTLCGHPEQVWVLREGVEIQVDFQQIVPGDQVVINAGEVIAVDGRVSSGMGQVDQHRLTGESQPADKVVGDKVLAATVLIAGRLEVEVITAGDQTVASKITQVLNQNKGYKQALITRGRKIGDQFVPVKLGLAGLAWPLLGPNASMAVMWANLGNGMSTMGPMIVMTYLQLLARQHILIKDAQVFESLREVDTIVFDKTGTLTEEQPQVGKIHALNGRAERDILRWAAAAEYRQSHPLARAILARASADHIEMPPLQDAHYEMGFGIKVSIEGQVIRVGSARFLAHEGIRFPGSTPASENSDELQTPLSGDTNRVTMIQQQAGEAGYSLIYVGVNEELVGILEMQPTIRPEASAMVTALKQRGITPYILSGDHEAPTRALAKTLGVEHYFAETLPEDKAARIQQLKDSGRFVAFVGDGINDAIALQTAQVSISMKGAASIATDTAHIIFMDGSLRSLLPLFEYMDEFEKTLRRALIIGFTPGTFTVAGVFFLHFGVVLSLMILYLNICAGLANTLWPMLKHQQVLPETDQSEAASTAQATTIVKDEALDRQIEEGDGSPVDQDNDQSAMLKEFTEK